MRILAACSTCLRQYEVRNLHPGAHFRCACSAVVTVPDQGQLYRDALHCGSCGANRQGSETSCRFCATAFAANDHNRSTTCPQCFARIDNDAKFCDHCGLGINAVQLAGEATALNCPVCGPSVLLNHRPLPGAESGVDECTQCQGMWLESARFQQLIAEAQRMAIPTKSAAFDPHTPSTRQKGPLYRPCAHCQEPMNRQNFGGKSGIVLDSCAKHGTWCDADELHRVLTWIGEGGLTRSREQEVQERKAAERRRPVPTPTMAADTSPSLSRDGFDLKDGLEVVVDFIGTLFSRRW